MTEPSFRHLVLVATGHEPYAYQRRLADEGPADVLAVPTGAGKTLAAVLPWLWRRRFHPDVGVRSATPRRLALVMPMRVLVEQAQGVVDRWLDELREDGDFDVESLLGPIVLRGGDGPVDRSWRDQPERDLVLIGTQDMLISRALNRGYGASRGLWPIDFALLNTDTHWVLDEVQLMGPSLPTSRQLQGLRHALGTAAPCTTTWMSATVDQDALITFDNPVIGRVREVEPEDRVGRLSRRLEAAKTVEEVSVPSGASRDRDLASVLMRAHQREQSSRTLAVVNSVKRATALYTELRHVAGDARVVLLHSRFRRDDRAAHLQALLDEPDHAGTFCVATQVVEAGVDVSAATLFTEAAPWSSIVQRAGRCNRYGDDENARLLWAEPPEPAPYEQDEVQAAAEALRALEGKDVTPATMSSLGPSPAGPVHAVLRRRDLIELFDTSADLAGDDIDVGRFIREGGDLDVSLFWRDLEGRGPSDEEPASSPEELCPVPIGQARKWLKGRQGVWRHDHVTGRWLTARPQDIRPGQVLMADAADGGYAPDMGWDASSRETVAPVGAGQRAEEGGGGDVAPDALGADPDSFTGRWVPLAEHLLDTEREARVLGRDIGWNAITAAHLEAVALAARYHDLGKADEGFQTMLLSTAGPEEHASLEVGGPWAKSAAGRGGRHPRRYFRHELASMLAVLAAPATCDGADLDLIAYLVLAHHGKARMIVRSMPSELDETGARVALGVVHGQPLGPVQIDAQTFPRVELDLSVTEMGEGEAGASWTARALALRDRSDLGPFRLAALEALVRLADWRASSLGREDAR